jgi:hypothetical protein
MRRKKRDEYYSDYYGALKNLPVEPDQRLRVALERASSKPYAEELRLMYELITLNSGLARYIERDYVASFANSVIEDEARVNGCAEICPSEFAYHNLMNTALRNRAADDSLSTTDIYRAWLLHDKREVGIFRPFGVCTLICYYGGDWDTPLSAVPKAKQALERLAQGATSTEDFQYILAFEGDRFVFRPTSVLDDYVQSEGGVLVPRRAVLTHFKDAFGVFTPDEIAELEELINNLKARELQFQRFFECHPHFFRRWDYREVHSHVYLTRGRNPLVPDFILTDREVQKAAIVELKLPKARLVRRQDNRDRFAEAVMEARAQLLTYRDWFRDASNRARLKTRVGMEIYEPHLAMIVGRSSDFQDDVDRQRLVAAEKDIEIVTYDDILRYAERRRAVIVSHH